LLESSDVGKREVRGPCEQISPKAERPRGASLEGRRRICDVRSGEGLIYVHAQRRPFEHPLSPEGQIALIVDISVSLCVDVREVASGSAQVALSGADVSAVKPPVVQDPDGGESDARIIAAASARLFQGNRRTLDLKNEVMRFPEDVGDPSDGGKGDL
jgi:hypothetical protein